VFSKHGLLTTVGYQFGKNTPAAYALEVWILYSITNRVNIFSTFSLNEWR